MKRLLIGQAIIGAIITCSLQCNSERKGEHAKATRVVRIPRRNWPGCTSAPEMDELFQLLRPGEETQVKVMFADAKNSLQLTTAPRITKGSVFFVSRAGYFRIDNKGKVYSSPDGQHEAELDVSYHGIEINYNSISNTSASSQTDLKYKIQPIKWEVIEGCNTGYISIRLSDDFKGDVLGWFSCLGM